jgi:hypothetical protein
MAVVGVVSKLQPRSNAMALPQNADISCLRGDPLQILVRVNGTDLSSATLMFAVGINRDPVGRAWVLTMQTVAGNEGIRHVRSNVDIDGLPYSIFEIVASKAKMAALPRSGEFGADVPLFYDLQSDRLNIPDTISNQETTLLRGVLIVKGSIND